MLHLRQLLNLFIRECAGVDVSTKLKDVFKEFKNSHSHIAIVSTVVNDEIRDNYYKTVGIITLEDIIETLIQEEIVDEYDQDEGKKYSFENHIT